MINAVLTFELIVLLSAAATALVGCGRLDETDYSPSRWRHPPL
jgi:hypothetical protein